MSWLLVLSILVVTAFVTTAVALPFVEAAGSGKFISYQPSIGRGGALHRLAVVAGKRQEGSSSVSAHLALSGTTVYTCMDSATPSIAAYWLTGKLRWAAQLKTAGIASCSGLALSPNDHVLVVTDDYGIGAGSHTAALDAGSGKQLWHGRFGARYVLANRVIASDIASRSPNQQLNTASYDLQTGEQEWVHSNGTLSERPRVSFGVSSADTLRPGPLNARPTSGLQTLSSDYATVTRGFAGSPTVFSLKTGKDVARLSGARSFGVFVYNNVVFSLGSSYEVEARDLHNPKKLLWKTEPNDNMVSDFFPCGAHRICAYGFSSITAFNTRTGEKEWSFGTSDSSYIESVGSVGENTVLFTDDDNYEILNKDGKSMGRSTGLDYSSTVLRTSSAAMITVSKTSTSYVSLQSGKETKTDLGSIATTDVDDCAWDDTFAACTLDDAFVIYRYRGGA